MTEKRETAIRLTDVRVDFDSARLQFDAAFEKGTVIAVVGASGSGKSTLLNLIAGFETPDAGTIEILGEDAVSRGAGERPVSVIFQEYNLFSHLDVSTNVGLGIDPALKLGLAEKARIAAALLRVGLEGFGNRKPATLSGGERQRVALARALVRRKPILLLDEPFAALDPGLRAGMIDLILGLHVEEKNTVLLVTHQPDDIKAMADSVLFLDRGQVVIHESCARFFERTDIAPIARFIGKN